MARIAGVATKKALAWERNCLQNLKLPTTKLLHTHNTSAL